MMGTILRAQGVGGDASQLGCPTPDVEPGETHQCTLSRAVHPKMSSDAGMNGEAKRAISSHASGANLGSVIMRGVMWYLM